MSENRMWKRVTAGTLALLVVAGTMPAGVNFGELIGGQSLVASAGTKSQEQFETIDTSAGTDGTYGTYNSTNCSVTGFYKTGAGNGVCLGMWSDDSGYKQRSITISASSGYKITKVEGTISWKNNNLTIGDLKTTAGTLSSDNFNTGGTLTVDNIEENVSEIVLSDNIGQGIIFNSLKVYYDEVPQEQTVTIDGLVDTNTSSGGSPFDITKNGFRFTGNSADGDGLNYGDEDGKQSVTITAPEGSVIKKLEFTTSWDDGYVGGTEANPGNVSVSGQTVTITNINSNSVVLSNSTADSWIQFNAVTITYVEAESSKTDLSTATVTVDTENKSVSIKLGNDDVPADGYDVTFEGVGDGNTYNSSEFPPKAGTYKAKVTGKGNYEGEATSAEFTVITYTKVEAVEPTVNSDGNIEYYLGSDGNFYSKKDSDTAPSYTLIEDKSSVIRSKIAVKLVDENPATVNADGMKAHYEDDNGNLYKVANPIAEAVDTNVREGTLIGAGSTIHWSGDCFDPEAVRKANQAVANVAAAQDNLNNANAARTNAENALEEADEALGYALDEREAAYASYDEERIAAAQVAYDDASDAYSAAGEALDAAVNACEDAEAAYNAAVAAADAALAAVTIDIYLDGTKVASLSPNNITYETKQSSCVDKVVSGDAVYLKSIGNDYYVPATAEELAISKLTPTKVEKVEPTVNKKGMEEHYEDDEGNLYTKRKLVGTIGRIPANALTVGNIIGSGGIIEPAFQDSYTIYVDGKYTANVGNDGNSYNESYTAPTDLIVDKIDGKTIYCKTYAYYDATDAKALEIQQKAVTPVNEVPATVNADGTKAHFKETDNPNNLYLKADVVEVDKVDVSYTNISGTVLKKGTRLISEGFYFNVFIDGEKANGTDNTYIFDKDLYVENCISNDNDGSPSFDVYLTSFDGSVYYKPVDQSDLVIERIATTIVPATAPTPNAPGNHEYFTDNNNNIYRMDDNSGMLQPATENDVIIPAVTFVEEHDYKAPTPTEEGNKKYAKGNDDKFYMESDVINSGEELDLSNLNAVSSGTVLKEGAVIKVPSIVSLNIYVNGVPANVTDGEDFRSYTVENDVVITNIVHSGNVNVNLETVTLGDKPYYKEVPENSWIIDKVKTTSVLAVEATPNTPGNSKYFKGDDNNFYTKEGNVYTKVSEGSWIIDKVKLSDAVQAVEATPNAAGNTEYYIGENNKFYKAVKIAEAPETSDFAASNARDLVGKKVVNGRVIVYVDDNDTKIYSIFVDNHFVKTISGYAEYEIQPDTFIERVDGNNIYLATIANAETMYVEIAEDSWIVPQVQIADTFDAVEPTPNAPGSSKYFIGDDHNYYALDEDGTTYNKITENSWIIPAVEITKTVPAVEATPNAPGNTEYCVGNNGKFYEIVEMANADEMEATFANAKDMASLVGKIVTFGDFDIVAENTEDTYRIFVDGVFKAKISSDTYNKYHVHGGTFIERVEGNDIYLVTINGAEEMYLEIAENSWIVLQVQITDTFEATEATPNAPGNSKYFKGDDNKYYALDEDGTTYKNIAEKSWVIPQVTVDRIDAVSPTPNAAGNSEYYIGSDNNYYKYDYDASKYVKIDKDSWVLPKTELTMVKAVAPTYTAPGNIEYFKDNDDNLYVMKNGQYVSTTAEDVIVAQLILEHVEYKEPDNKNQIDGNIEYWYDSANNKYFTDDKGEKEIPYEDTVIPAKHTWKASWKWAKDYSSATLTLDCANCDEQVTLTAKITETREEPTCSKTGKITYTATAVYENTRYSYDKTVIIPVSDHTYGEPEWQWIDATNVKATFTCTECGTSETVVAVVREEKTPATVTAPGKIVYTASATMGGKTYQDSRTVRLPKLPAAPTLSYTPGAGSVKLEWEEVEGAEKYAVFGFINNRWQNIDKGTGTSYVLKDLKAGSRYKVAVIAKVNGEWIQDFSKAIVVTPKAETAETNYPKVTSIDYNETYHQFRLNWGAVDGAEKYGVAVFLANKWKIVTQDIPANTTSFTSPKLKAGQTYNMVICAKVGGKWDTSNLNSRAFSVTVK